MAQTALKTAEGAESLQGDFERWPSGDGTVCAITGSAATVGVGRRLGQMITALRRDRQKNFPGVLASDSHWAVILQLYAAHVDQHRLHIGTLTKRAGVPGTTVLRAISALDSAGFLTRSNDRFDRRRVIVELSEAGVAAMNRYLQNAGSRAVFL